ncbi:hypothetical protein K9U39_06110 [Rhodoblastus acidophilus]|uniref:Uncharacterized protein n=1 Tax=Candidatus Rhodoblastus alkanivorans TaxID=2954117 RepID=A0ABS9Z6B7_9HYPH|nr:hypothetical protein [Candidatus Rhodoblastus alkanivorans]MCI4680422.1 hypothetical protein [Candidatus Rhodoblastus alkanivorans]MCI4683215.1 hypothetical protein [Candidatus Rhodoblastus alkanivorans]MDI4640527.1 hypothetical protein [Rhodoblastus acidophilus]
MKLTGILAEIAVAAGEEAAMSLARAHGGTRVYMPGILTLQKCAEDGHWLARLVGLDAARKIAAACAGARGLHIEIPFGPAARDKELRREIWRLLDEGKSARTIVRTLGCTDRTVRVAKLARKMSQTREGNSEKDRNL